MMLEQTILTLAQQRYQALKALAGNHMEFQDVRDCFFELSGLTSLRFIDGTEITSETADALTLIDNLAILTLQSVNPETMELFPRYANELNTYLKMPERELVDLIFKEGGRFNNQEAISVAMHRGLIDNIHNESEAYERVAASEAATSEN